MKFNTTKQVTYTLLLNESLKGKSHNKYDSEVFRLPHLVPCVTSQANGPLHLFLTRKIQHQGCPHWI